MTTLTGNIPYIHSHKRQHKVQVQDAAIGDAAAALDAWKMKADNVWGVVCMYEKTPGSARRGMPEDPLENRFLARGPG